jgi:hypothetical protein
MNTRWQRAVGIGSLVSLLFGCGQYDWEKKFPPSDSHEWVVVHDRGALVRVCAIENPYLAACAFQLRGHPKGNHCVIYSIHTEEQAKRLDDGEGRSLVEHELKHCQGWRHD